MNRDHGLTRVAKNHHRFLILTWTRRRAQALTSSKNHLLDHELDVIHPETPKPM
jgi:hypothetical protein